MRRRKEGREGGGREGERLKEERGGKGTKRERREKNVGKQLDGMRKEISIYMDREWEEQVWLDRGDERGCRCDLEDFRSRDEAGEGRGEGSSKYASSDDRRPHRHQRHHLHGQTQTVRLC